MHMSGGIPMKIEIKKYIIKYMLFQPMLVNDLSACIYFDCCHLRFFLTLLVQFLVEAGMFYEKIREY